MQRRQRKTITSAVLTVGAEILITGWAAMLALGMLAGWTSNHGIDVGFWPALALAVLVKLAVIPSRQHKER